MIESFLYHGDIYSIKNDENFEINNYTPFNIHFILSNLKLKRKDNQRKKLKISIIKSGNILSNFNLERFCNLKELKGFKLNKI